MAKIQAAKLPMKQDGWPVAEVAFVSFDGGVGEVSRLQRPDRYRFFGAGSGAESRDPAGDHCIPRGAGLSYAAASFGRSSVSIEHGNFNRILGLDSNAGTVKVEAGITLEVLCDFLTRRGFYLPILPGHGAITVGGCIAADVHGKNHARDGTFINQVHSLSLFHPEHGVLEISRSQEAELFELTCGGYGLTGHILGAELAVAPLPGTSVIVHAQRSAHVLDGVKELLVASARSDFAYSWHDFSRSGPDFGKGFVFSASFALDGLGATDDVQGNKAKFSAQKRGALPLSLLNGWTSGLLSRAYALRTTLGGAEKRVSLRSALFPAQQTEVYFKLFGRRGFHEYQVLVPWSSAESYLREVESYLAHARVPVTLASAKAFAGRGGLLRFSGEGLCFALNVPRTNQARPLLEFLDALLPKVGAIPNIIKDSRLGRSVVDHCYPEADQFRSRLRSFDPRRMFQSELSQRLGL